MFVVVWACIKVIDDMSRMVTGHRYGLVQVQDLNRIKSIENVLPCSAGRMTFAAFSIDCNRNVIGSAGRTIKVSSDCDKNILLLISLSEASLCKNMLLVGL